MRRQQEQPAVIDNGHCCGCCRDRKLYRVSDGRYRCSDCSNAPAQLQADTPAAADLVIADLRDIGSKLAQALQRRQKLPTLSDAELLAQARAKGLLK
jgi:ribosomal protein L37AE/L43A